MAKKFDKLRGLIAPLVAGCAQALMLLSTCNFALGQTISSSIVPNAWTQFINANGQPLAGGSVYTYVPNTTTLKTTWVDPYENTPNANPVVLNTAGEAQIFGQGNYTETVYDANGNLQWSGFTSAYGSAQPSGATGTDTAPLGTVMPFSGFVVPTNWLLAYGQSVSRTTYALLEAAITISSATANCTLSGTSVSGFSSTAQMAVGEAGRGQLLA